MVVVLYILGVTSIREFALPMAAGIIAGTFSSVFISATLWCMMKGEKPVKGRKAAKAENK
jgi:preprotein translocase subunit SecF